MRIEQVRTVVLGGGRSQRMGFDKLIAPFAGEPLAHRIARALAELHPLFVTTAAVAQTLADLRVGAGLSPSAGLIAGADLRADADLRGVDVVITEPTAGLSETLALAHAAIAPELYLAVLPCDVPFVDAALVTAFVERVPDDVDLAWPVVDGTPGHPVIWSPKARTHILALRADEQPSRLRRDPALRVAGLAESGDAYVTDADTPEAWAAAEARARRDRR